MPFVLREFTVADSDVIHRINDSEIPNVTKFAPGDLDRLAKQAPYFRVAETASDEIVGFLLALDQTAVYESLNFQWFKARYRSFVYVDRIVVPAHAQGQGIGHLLYKDLIEKTAAISRLVTCEVNIRPPNPRSLGFHQSLGFKEVGTQETEGGKKTVALLAMSSE